MSIALLLAFSLGAWAQGKPDKAPSLPDSVLKAQRLVRSRNYAIDTTLYRSYIALYRASTHPDSQLFYIRRARALAYQTPRIQDDISAGLAHLRCQIRHSWKDSVLFYGEEMLTRFAPTGNNKVLGEIHVRLAGCCHEAGDYPEAMKHVLKALQLVKGGKDSLIIGMAHAQFGLTHGQYGNAEEVRQAYRTALRYLAPNRFANARTLVLNNLANLYYDYPDSALFYLRQAYAIVKPDLLANASVGYAVTSMVEMFLKKKQLDSARHYATIAEDFFEKRHMDVGLANLYHCQALIELAERRPHAALTKLKQMLTVATDAHLQRSLRDAYLSMSEAYVMLGDYEQAYTHLTHQQDITDSLMAPQLGMVIQRLVQGFNAEMRQQRLAQLEAESQHQQALVKQNNEILWVVLAITVVLALVSAFGLVTYRRLQKEQERLKHYRELKDAQHRELQESARTKDQLLTIIAQDLRQPIATLAALPDQMEALLQQECGLTTEVAALQQTTTSVTTLLDGLLTWAQAQQGSLPLQPELVVMEPLLQRAFMGIPATMRNCVSMQVPPDLTVRTDPTALETLLRQLVQLALRHAHPQAPVQLSISAHANSWQVVLEKSANLETASTPGYSLLNQTVIFDLVHHLGGIEVVSPQEVPHNALLALKLPLAVGKLETAG